MLGKLIKHEWKSVCKFGGILMLAIMILSVLGYLFLQTPVFRNLITNEVEVNEAQSIALVLTSVGSFVLYVLFLVGAAYGILIYSGVHFYQSMYTDRGYLTHTLPVSSGKILASKLLVSGIWVFLVYAAVYASIVMLVAGMLQGLLGGVELEISFAELWNEMVKAYKEIGWDMNHYIVILVLVCLLSPFTSLIQIFAALTIGQLSRKHKLMMGILTYFGITIVNHIISFLLETIISMRYMITAEGELSMGFMTATYDVSLIYSCVVAVILYVVTHLIAKKRLNMD